MPWTARFWLGLLGGDLRGMSWSGGFLVLVLVQAGVVGDEGGIDGSAEDDFGADEFPEAVWAGEEEFGACVEGEPGLLFHFAFELAGAPAAVAGEEFGLAFGVCEEGVEFVAVGGEFDAWEEVGSGEVGVVGSGMLGGEGVEEGHDGGFAGSS